MVINLSNNNDDSSNNNITIKCFEICMISNVLKRAFGTTTPNIIVIQLDNVILEIILIITLDAVF